MNSSGIVTFAPFFIEDFYKVQETHINVKADSFVTLLLRKSQNLTNNFIQLIISFIFPGDTGDMSGKDISKFLLLKQERQSL